jgi:hypothetical protein
VDPVRWRIVEEKRDKVKWCDPTFGIERAKDLTEISRRGKSEPFHQIRTVEVVRKLTSNA